MTHSESEILPPKCSPTTHLRSLGQYREQYAHSVKDPQAFFSAMGNDLIHWHSPPKTIFTGGLMHGDHVWFEGGKLNVSYNCIDRHALKNPNKIAIIYEHDEPGNSSKITYQQLLQQGNNSSQFQFVSSQTRSSSSRSRKETALQYTCQ